MRVTKDYLMEVIKEAILQEMKKAKKTENVGLALGAINAAGTVSDMMGSKDEQTEETSKLRIKKRKKKQESCK